MRKLGAVGALAVLAALVSVWAAAWVPDPDIQWRPDRNWETAKPADCALLAQGVRALAARSTAATGALIGNAPSGGPCIWPQQGLDFSRLTYRDFDRARRSGLYTPHLALTRPSYSVLHLRAAVAAGYFHGPLSAEGYVCHFRLSIGGWRLQECRLAYVA